MTAKKDRGRAKRKKTTQEKQQDQCITVLALYQEEEQTTEEVDEGLDTMTLLDLPLEIRAQVSLSSTALIPKLQSLTQLPDS